MSAVGDSAPQGDACAREPSGVSGCRSTRVSGLHSGARKDHGDWGVSVLLAPGAPGTAQSGKGEQWPTESDGSDVAGPRLWLGGTLEGTVR